MRRETLRPMAEVLEGRVVGTLACSYCARVFHWGDAVVYFIDIMNQEERLRCDPMCAETCARAKHEYVL